MITKQKITIYKKYHGDGDMWLRIGTDEEKSSIDYNDWKLIDNMIQDAILVLGTQASVDFKANFENELQNNCADVSTQQFLIEVAKAFIRR